MLIKIPHYISVLDGRIRDYHIMIDSVDDVIRNNERRTRIETFGKFKPGRCVLVEALNAKSSAAGNTTMRHVFKLK